MNTTELLSVIIKGMSDKGIELTGVELYEEAVDINSKVKVCLVEDNLSKYLVHKVNEVKGFNCYTTDEMVDKVIELLKHEFNQGDYITEGEHSGILIRVGDDEYHVVNLETNETIHYQTSSLEELVNMGWRKFEIV